MFFLNLLSEEPKKFQNLLIKLIKLLLTILVVELFSGSRINYDFSDIASGSLHITLFNLLVSILVLVGAHFIIWYLLFGVFVSIFSFHLKSKSNTIQKQDIQSILNNIRIHKKTKGNYFVPTRRVGFINDLMKSLKDSEFSLIYTSFSEWLYTFFVAWIFLLVLFWGQLQFIIWFVVSGVIIVLALIIGRSIDKLIEAIKSNSWEIISFLEVLIFRNKLLELLKNNFEGKLNEEETAYTIKLNNKLYTIWDFAYPSEIIGQLIIRKLLGTDDEKLKNNVIIITNIAPDAELIRMLDEKGVKGYIHASSDQEIFEKLVLFSVQEEHSESLEIPKVD